MESLPNPISSFTPTPAQAEFIIHSITSRDTTLAHIGAHCQVTVETLCAWLATPAIRARLEATDTTTCHTIRIRASVLLPLALGAAARILQDFTSASDPTPSHASPARHSIDPALLAHRRAETARKAAVLILRLTNHQPAHARRAPAPSSAPSTTTPHNTGSTPTDQPIPSALAALAAHVDTDTTAIKPTPESTTAPSAPIASAPTPATIEHVLDLIATLSPEQIADLTALTSLQESDTELALATEDSS